jgi:DNA-binding GntR family transcriptional regulator
MVEEYIPLDHTDLTEQTYIVLKDRILTRQLHPKERISVTDVANGLGVSRTPVTDALKRLAAEGLVEIVPRVGTFVTELTARDVAELFDLRLLLESYAIDRIFENGQVDEVLANIQDSIDIMSRATNDDDYGDYEAFIEGDRQLHLSFIHATKNTHLMEMYTELNVHMHVARAHYINSIENAREAHMEHEAIVEAFKSKDEERVKFELASHITTVKNRILAVLEEHGGKL